jgi:hypothetical protein
MLSSKQFLNKRKKRSPAQIKQLLHARQQIKATEKENHGLIAKSLPSRTTQTETRSAGVLASIKSRLTEAVEKLSVCTLEVHQQRQELAKKTTLLANANGTILLLKASLASSRKELFVAHERIKLYYSLLRNERRKAARAKAAAARANAEIRKLQGNVIPSMQRQAAAQLRRLTEENTAQVVALRKRADSSAGEVSRLRAELVQTRKKVHALQMRVHRASRALARVISKSRTMPKNSSSRQLYRKGAYTAEFRALARRLVLAGCAQKSVGPIIQAMLKALHIPLGNRCMSARTVQRAILEGGVAAKVQLGHEIMQTKSEL